MDDGIHNRRVMGHKRVVFESTVIEDAQTTTLGGRCHFCSSASLHILLMRMFHQSVIVLTGVMIDL